MKKKYIYLEYKYANEPWRTYDYTSQREWAQIQFSRMKIDHPGAEYRQETR